jgi:hypothetical protein
MVRTRSFSTRNGYCHLLSDTIKLEYPGLTGKLHAWLERRGWRSVGWLYLLLAVGFGLAVLLALGIENYFLALFLGVFGLIALYGSWARRKYAISPVIQRKHIESVQYFPAVKGISRARFEVYFRPGKRLFIREIPLPSLLQNGQTEAQSAYWMMREEGLIQE